MYDNQGLGLILLNNFKYATKTIKICSIISTRFKNYEYLYIGPAAI